MPTYSSDSASGIWTLNQARDAEYVDAWPTMIPPGWNLSTLSYDSKSLSVATQTTYPQGVFIHPDGEKLYVNDNVGASVYEYDLSTAFDVSSGTYSQSFSYSAQESSGTDLFFKGDGTRMYIVGFGSDAVNEYSLSTAWDVSTATFNSTFSMLSQDSSIQGVFFKPDGTKFYMTGRTNDAVYQYSMTTAWDVSTASYDSTSFSVSSQETNPTQVWFKSDGSKMYVIGNVGDDINEYSLTTEWDISTASYVNNYAISQDATPQGFCFTPYGDKMYVAGFSNNTIYQYSLGG